MTDDPRLMNVFYDMQSGLPRQGPGDRQSTEQAFALCAELPSHPSVLDVGCGPGAQTMALANVCDGTITAVDNCEEYLEELRRKSQASPLSSRIIVANEDMADMSFSDGQFDLVWSEGAAYIVGIQNALSTWRSLLRPRGYLAITELVWLTPDPPDEVARFFEQEYPAMDDIPGVRQVFSEKDYDLVDDFTLPDSAWWDDYYSPLEAKLPALQEKYAGDHQALEIVAMTEREIAMRRRFGETYGYQFFVARKQV